MKTNKKKKRISLHNRLSFYNFLVAIVPVFIAVCMTFTFIFSLIQMIYSDDDGSITVDNSRDVITVYFCQFNIRIIEKIFNDGNTEKAPHIVSDIYRRLESYGFSVCVTIDGETLYLSENTQEGYFDELNKASQDYGGGFVFLDDNTMQIHDTEKLADGRNIDITLKSSGQPNEKRTSVTLKLLQLSNTNFALVLITVMCLVAIIDIYLVRSLSRSMLIPIENLSNAANKIKLGNLDEPVSIDETTQELGELGKSFEEMRLQLKSSVESHEEYEQLRRNTYSGLNHDIRTAVTTIKGYTHGLMDGIANTPEKKERYINAISLYTESLEKLVDALSEITDLEANSVAFQFKECEMNSLIRDWYEESSPYFEARGIKVSININCTVKTYCELDTFQFERVVDNLLSNCVKYRKPDAEFIDVSITAGISEDNMFEIVYKDNGIGISDEDARRVFEVFFRADEARSNTINGSGIGLSIVKQIIIRHGGSIRAGGKKGECLILTIKLPIKRTEE